MRETRPTPFQSRREALTCSVYFPLGFANESNFKNGVLITACLVGLRHSLASFSFRHRCRPQPNKFLSIRKRDLPINSGGGQRNLFDHFGAARDGTFGNSSFIHLVMRSATSRHFASTIIACPILGKISAATLYALAVAFTI
uniref:Uncharacterized protein n=1 Tax=Candidatus Kentrum sp. TUN TaxID=2126343 RepID=A0A450ZCM5_9GAMM|nr:MAG: hypothetical protein BECKTUN1418E_GA0071001_100263 [Candidatus Kentron sp. TUN]VFK51556.1 MAG: hypothetical protein BECKTUN1418F_GA0071002_100261 [Candidatus Kentron sp. TUN]